MECNPSPSEARRALAFLADPSALPSTDGGAPEPGEANGAVRGGVVRYQLQALHAQGGIGQVWQARDGQLGRVVALKELRPENQDHAGLRRRFLMEAQITGQLNHPGIVPVHELVTPADGETPYYVMRFVEGRTLTHAARDYHEKRRQGRAAEVELRDLLGAFVSVCNTLAYAHARGVIHRDLKGANVLLGDFGEVLVVDWGTAKVLGTKDERIKEPPVMLDTVVEVIKTGAAVLGTPAYMAPEQAEGHTELTDQRTDVFGLGAVLYEILTGGSPYAGASKREVLDKAKEGKPVSPRRVASWVPRPLEAVCLKALAAQPEQRYATAAELADEVKRWLSGEPVRAWAEPWGVRVGRWVRQHRVVSAITATVVLMGIVVGSAWGVYSQQQRARAGDHVRAGLLHANELRDRYRYDDAGKTLRRVRELVRLSGDPRLRVEITNAEASVTLARDLDRIRLEAATLVNGQWNPKRIRTEYRQTLLDYGLDVLQGDVDTLATKIRHLPVPSSIVAALEDWAIWEPRSGRQRLLELADRVDEPDSWRQAVRRAAVADQKHVARELARRPVAGKPTPTCVLLLVVDLPNGSEEAVRLLRRAQQDHPRDFWVNFTLGHCLDVQKKYRESAACFLQATAIRTDNATTYNQLGNALLNQRDMDGARRAYEQAIALEPNHAKAHSNLAAVFGELGDEGKALALFHRAIEIDRRLAAAHTGLGIMLTEKGQYQEAIRSHQEAINLEPRFAMAHNNLGNVLVKTGDVEGARHSYAQAIACDPRLTYAHTSLGGLLLKQGKVDQAVQVYDQATTLDPASAAEHNASLARALHRRGDVNAAIRVCERAVRLAPASVQHHSNLAFVLSEKGNWVKAKQSLEQALLFDPNNVKLLTVLGDVTSRLGDFAASVRCYERAIACGGDTAALFCNLGVALFNNRQTAESITRYRQAIAKDAKCYQAHCGLANALRSQGYLDEAIASCRKALEVKPRYAEAHTNLALCLRERGQMNLAIRSFRDALRDNARLPNAHLGLGKAWMDVGQFSAAQESFRTVMKLLPSNHALHRDAGQQLQRCQVFLACERELTGHLKGNAPATDPMRLVDLAYVASRPSQGHYHLAARLYRQAFTGNPKLAEDGTGHRLCAALAALSVGRGSEQLSEVERAGWRTQALTWLRADLALWTKQIDQQGKTVPVVARKALSRWMHDPLLAVVRDQDALAKLPEGERWPWVRLWADVEELLGRSKVIR